ncbi:AsmA-like C-terminal region-containing protein [Falsirhodobacter sp. 1013]|uniref:AsmA-like C-terminal region-containing protein n=1 Tax=Falsirhodobacter sp. 1013 TaxID=3417566 RepID=UPI003EB7A78E
MAGRRGQAWRIVAWVAVPVVGLPLAVAGFLALSGQPLPLPRAVLDLAQTQIDLTLRRAGTVGTRVQVGGVSIALDRAFRPRIEISDIRVSDRGGSPMMVLPAARVTFNHPTLAEPLPAARAITLDGARLNVRRREDGSFDLAFGVAASESPIQSYAQALDEIRRILTLPVAEALRFIDVRNVGVTIDDARAGRVWELADGTLTLRRPENVLQAELSADVDGTSTGRVGIGLAVDPASGTTAIKVRVDGVAAPDIAAQAAPLAPLNVLRAEVAGTMAASVDGEGTLTGFDAALDLGPGALAPREGMEPIPFDSAAMALAYDPAARTVTLNRLNVQGPMLRVTADGKAYLRDLKAGIPETILGQLRFQDIAVDLKGQFIEPVRFSSGMLDARLRLDPFTVEIGQLALVEGDRILRGHGRVSADEGGWRLSFDPSLNRIRRDQLLALWPVRLVPRTREWLDENVLEGDLRNVRAAIRIAPGQEPRVSLNYGFQGGDVRFLRTLPPIEGGEGYASIHAERYAMKLARGHVTPPLGGPVTADGSTLVVPDLRDRPIHVNINLKTDSSVTAALSLLDEPPFRFLSRAGRSPDIGTGRAQVQTLLTVPVVPDLDPDDVGFDVQGRITDFTSSTLIEGKHLTAPELRLTANPDALTVGGEGELETVPFRATYRLPLKGGTPTVDGTATLSQGAVDAFRIGLPKGLISGRAPGTFHVDLPKGGAPELHLTSDLKGIGAGLAAIGWSKPANATGALEVQATLGDVPEVHRLHVEGGGLDATGAVRLTAEGGLRDVRLSRVRLNGWLDAPVVLTARAGQTTPAVAVTGGTVDLRRLDLGDGGGEGDGDSGNTPIDARLDTLRVTDTLTLTDMDGTFATAGGFQGRFTGRVNGGTPVSGDVGPAAHGTAVHLVSQDAGGVLQSAGIFSKAAGGAVDLRLTPRAAKGEYDGQAVAQGMRINDLPLAAGVVNALSGIGAADQLANGGILFDQATAAFRLTPDAIEVHRGEATSPSLGVTAEGVYRMADQRFFLQGVVSPVWFLNGAGSHDGEGVFGAAYTLRGTVDDPEIGVNPLTLLAPGAMRDLFRGPAPRLAE